MLRNKKSIPAAIKHDNHYIFLCFWMFNDGCSWSTITSQYAHTTFQASLLSLLITWVIHWHTSSLVEIFRYSKLLVLLSTSPYLPVKRLRFSTLYTSVGTSRENHIWQGWEDGVDAFILLIAILFHWISSLETIGCSKATWNIQASSPTHMCFFTTSFERKRTSVPIFPAISWLFAFLI